jgi:hypothetical protein
MTNFNQHFADQNKLQELNQKLDKLQSLNRQDDDNPKAAMMVEAGYPIVKNLEIEQTKAAIRSVEKRIKEAANDTF